MISLFMDASLNCCNLAIIQDSKVIKQVSIKTNNNLTDLIVEHIDNLLSSAHLKHADIESLLICVGPGSFTGIRVVSTIAKTWNFTYQTPVYTINSLRLQLPDHNGISLIDAKGNNWYIVIYQNNKLITKPQMVNKTKLYSIVEKYGQLKVYTDYQTVNIFKNVIFHRNNFKLMKDIHKLVPLYIKKAL